MQLLTNTSKTKQILIINNNKKLERSKNYETKFYS